MATLVAAQEEYAAPVAEPPVQAYAEYFAGVITPDYVNSLTEPTQEFLCPLNANIYDMDFISFKLRALEQGGERVLMNVAQTFALPPPSLRHRDDSSRFIQYPFGPDFLDITTIGSTLGFTNGAYEARGFRMIERHYFRNQLVRSFDFEMPYVPPNTSNTWEFMYEMPELNDDWKAALIASPWETRSDSFYFVGEQLVMHNRAEYSYQ